MGHLETTEFKEAKLRDKYSKMTQALDNANMQQLKMDKWGKYVEILRIFNKKNFLEINKNKCLWI